MNNHKVDSKVPNITYQASLVYSFVLYNASDRENITPLLLTCQSRSETFGQVVLEAMASGLPVAGVQSEGVCDLVDNGDTGFLLDTQGLSEKAEALAYQELLEHLIANAAVRHRMGQAALREAQQRSWSAAMKSLVQGYEEVIEATRPLAVA